MAMALDEPRDTDSVYDINGFKYLVDKDFMEKATPIKVDFNAFGFQIVTSINLEAACSSCGTQQGSCCS